MSFLKAVLVLFLMCLPTCTKKFKSEPNSENKTLSRNDQCKAKVEEHKGVQMRLAGKKSRFELDVAWLKKIIPSLRLSENTSKRNLTSKEYYRFYSTVADNSFLIDTFDKICSLVKIDEILGNLRKHKPIYLVGNTGRYSMSLII